MMNGDHSLPLPTVTRLPLPAVAVADLLESELEVTRALLRHYRRVFDALRQHGREYDRAEASRLDSNLVNLIVTLQEGAGELRKLDEDEPG